MVDLRDVSFIVPTNRESIHTVKSIPPECEIIIPKSSPLGRARNDGIKQVIK